MATCVYVNLSFFGIWKFLHVIAGNFVAWVGMRFDIARLFGRGYQLCGVDTNLIGIVFGVGIGLIYLISFNWYWVFFRGFLLLYNFLGHFLCGQYAFFDPQQTILCPTRPFVGGHLYLVN